MAIHISCVIAFFLLGRLSVHVTTPSARSTSSESMDTFRIGERAEPIEA